MGTKQLLDCTLRDGGYVNDWEFGHNNLISIFERLVDTGVDIIEVGFLDDRRPFDINRSIMPDTVSTGKIWQKITKRPPMVVGMIDYGTCDIENIQPREESFLDGIRVIFKKHRKEEALAFCAQLKALGYHVFAQLVSITSYNDDDLMDLIQLANDVEPYAVSMVDTYGLLHPADLLHYSEILDKHLKPGIHLGFHPHNNFQLAYANALTFLERKTERDILVDGTLFGMGKSAGNAPLELIGMLMNQEFGCDYKIAPMLEAIEESVKSFFERSPWGYKTFFYLCASNDCHPSYVEYFQKKGNLSLSGLYTLLSRIEPEEKKLLYDRELAEQLYQKYIAEQTDDRAEFTRMHTVFGNRNILLVGPGKNIELQKNKVIRYVDQQDPIVISINYIPKGPKVDYVFVTKSSRYQQMTDKLHEHPEIRLIATSNLECKNGAFAFHINRAPLLEEKEVMKDNSLLMLLKILKNAGVKQVACAGFDGYSDHEDNYLEPSMEYEFVKREASHLNHHIREVLSTEFADMEINFITYSHYMDSLDMDSAAW